MSNSTAFTLSVLRETVGKPVGTEEKGATSGLHAVGPGFSNLVKALGLNSSQRPLSLAESLQIAAFLLCLDVIAQDIAKSTLRLKRRTTNGGSEIVLPREHWLAELLAVEPNEEQTWYEWKEMVFLYFCAVQNSFVAKRLTATGETRELIPLMPASVTVHRAEDGTRFYRVSATSDFQRAALDGFDVFLRDEQMIHARARVYDGQFGYSTLLAGSKAMRLAEALQDYQTRLYQSDGQMRGVFQTDKNFVTDEAFRRLRDQLAEASEKWHKKNRPLVLEDGLKFEAIGMNAAEAEVSKVFDAQVVEMCRLLRVPPHKVMHLNAVKYENLEAMENGYVNDTLVPRARAMEERLLKDLLPRSQRVDYFLEFDREEMAARDSKTQAEVIDKLVKIGVMKIDEARARRGLNPLPNREGDVRVLPVNMGIIKDGEFTTASGVDPKTLPAQALPDDDKKQAGLRLIS
jgi:HK97 family phage portal protein